MMMMMMMSIPCTLFHLHLEALHLASTHPNASENDQL